MTSIEAEFRGRVQLTPYQNVCVALVYDVLLRAYSQLFETGFLQLWTQFGEVQKLELQTGHEKRVLNSGRKKFTSCCVTGQSLNGGWK
jgi:hypothetical protein